MIFENQSRNRTLLAIVSVAALAFGTAVLLYSPVILQEGNPWPQIEGIAQLHFTGKDMVKLSGGEDRYMTKGKNGIAAVTAFMEDKGYEFTEQLGSGYLFRSSTGGRAIATHRYYSSFYSLWSITENSNESDADSGLWASATTDDGLTFRYPKELPVKYISEDRWPPEVIMEDRQYSCLPSGNEIQLGGRTEPRSVDSRQYCVTKESEGAAGSVYTAYAYAFPAGSQTGTIAFVLRFVQCQNYDEPKATECENERSAFDIDGIVDRIAQSIRGGSDFDSRHAAP